MKDVRLKFTLFLCCFALCALSTSLSAQCEREGLPCSDRNDCTINDTIGADCKCVGELVPGCDPCDLGMPCDDGNPCTTNDRMKDDCECGGTFVDGYDPATGTCDGRDEICELEGQACNDSNPSTINDVYNADCECKGVFRASVLQMVSFIKPNATSDDGPTESLGSVNGSDLSNASSNPRAFSVNPNPTANDVVLHFEDVDLGKGSAQIQIFTTNGTVVYDETVDNVNGLAIDAQDFATGTYIVVVKANNKVFNQRLIKVQ